MARYLLSITLLLALIGFASLGAGQNSAEEVRFIIPIPVEQFSKDAILFVKIRNPEQIERSKNNTQCGTRLNLETHTTTHECPDGVEYLEVTPEVFKFPIETILVDVEVLSKTVKVGDEYKLSVFGESVAYGNNTAKAGMRGIAQEETITIPTARTRDGEGLKWRHTCTY